MFIVRKLKALLLRHEIVHTCMSLWRLVQSRMWIAVAASFVAAFIVRFVFVDTTNVLGFHADAYLYLLKALEIAAGNWTPMLTHAYGISIITAPLFLLFPQSSLFEYMQLAQYYSIFLGSFLVVPTYLVARELLPKAGQLAVLMMVVVQPHLIHYSAFLLSDSLFAILVLFALYFTLRTRDAAQYIYVASSFAAVAYYVRPNGVFIIVAIILSFIVVRYGKKWRELLPHIVVATLLFAVMVTPMLATRATEFGSAFTYGENDKILVDNYTHDVWAPNIPTPNIGEFLVTHSLGEVTNKFVVQGLIKLVFSLVHGWEAYTYGPIILPIVLPFLVVGFGASVADVRWRVPYVFLFTFVGALALVFSVYSAPHYMLFAIPIFSMIAYRGIEYLVRGKKHECAIASSLVGLIVLFSFITPVLGLRAVADRQALPDWSFWAAAHVRGTILTMDEGDYLMMQLPDTTVGGTGLFALHAPQSGVSIRRYGQFTTLQEALAYHIHEHQVTHLLVSNYSRESRPYLEELFEDSPPPYVQKIYADTEGQVWIFAIDWDVFNELPANNT